VLEKAEPRHFWSSSSASARIHYTSLRYEWGFSRFPRQHLNIILILSSSRADTSNIIVIAQQNQTAKPQLTDAGTMAELLNSRFVDSS
jgi:hypothetical protein